VRLGVNIDHVATLRNARGERYPDPATAAARVVAAGADLVTCHPRLDQRHIRFEDLPALRRASPVLNLEMAAVDAMLDHALRLQPDWACIVPETREEITTEGGLDVDVAALPRIIERLKRSDIKVSLFIDPDERSVRRSADLGADAVELHTGAYAQADPSKTQTELQRLVDATEVGLAAGIAVHAGHGLTLDNLSLVAAIPGIQELNIGHALICDALFVGGLEASVAAYKARIASARES